MNGSTCQSNVSVDLTLPIHTRFLSLVGSIGEEVAQGVDPYSGDRDALGYNLNLVLTEAMANVIEHTAVPATKDIHITIRATTDELCIRVRDYGEGFDIDEIPLPDLDNPTGNGLGIFLMKSLMDSVYYNKAPSGNILEMRKKLA